MELPKGPFIFLMVLAGLGGLLLLAGIGLGVFVSYLWMTHWYTEARDWFKKRRQEKKKKMREKQLLNTVPIPLDSARKRSLTNLKDENSQSQSGFFRLPYELREQILVEALGGTLHICRVKKRMAYLRYHPVNEELQNRIGKELPIKDVVRLSISLWRYAYDSKHGGGVYLNSSRSWPRKKSNPNEPSSNNLIAPLLVCKRLYGEAAPILYQRNTFELDNLFNVTHFAQTTLPHRFRSIQSLILNFYINDNIHSTRSLPYDWQLSTPTRDTWRRAWRTIATIEGLRSLRVRLGLALDRLDDDATTLNWYWESDLLAPLRDVRVMGDFIVETSWDTGRQVEGPFTIQRYWSDFDFGPGNWESLYEDV